MYEGKQLQSAKNISYDNVHYSGDGKLHYALKGTNSITDEQAKIAIYNANVDGNWRAIQYYLRSHVGNSTTTHQSYWTEYYNAAANEKNNNVNKRAVGTPNLSSTSCEVGKSVTLTSSGSVSSVNCNTAGITITGSGNSRTISVSSSCTATEVTITVNYASYYEYSCSYDVYECDEVHLVQWGGQWVRNKPASFWQPVGILHVSRTLQSPSRTVTLKISRPTANVSVNTYIYSINGCAEGSVQYKNGSTYWQDKRDWWTEAWKKDATWNALGEVGDQIIFKTVVTNNGNKDTGVYIKVGATGCDIDGNASNTYTYQHGGFFKSSSEALTNRDNSRPDGGAFAGYAKEEVGGVIKAKGGKLVVYLVATINNKNGGTGSASIVTKSNAVSAERKKTGGLVIDGKEISWANSKTSSEDHFACKQYNIKVYDVFVSGSYDTSSQFYKSFGRSQDDREKPGQDTKEGNPHPIENGDTVEFTIKVRNEASSAAPYYLPGPVKAVLSLTALPYYTDTAHMSVTGGTLSGNTITTDWIESGDTKVITVRLKVHDIPTTGANANPKRWLTAQASGVVNRNYKTGSQITATIASSSATDWYVCKKYNVTVKTYITAVNGVNVTNRSSWSTSMKNYNAEKIENGDTVTFAIAVTNHNYTDYPYKSPDRVNATIKCTLPTNAGNLTKVSGDGTIGANNTVTVNNIGTGATKTIYVSIKSNASSNVIISINTKLAFAAQVTNIANRNGNTEGTGAGGIVNTQHNYKSIDFYQFKAYRVVVDQYISEVSHWETAYPPSVTWSSDSRSGKTDTAKNNDLVYAENGDLITYKIDVYNTMPNPEYPSLNRANSPYYNPDYVRINANFVVPASDAINAINIDGTVGDWSWTRENGTIQLKNVYVPAGGKITVIFKLVVADYNRNDIKGTTFSINEVLNRNGCSTKNLQIVNTGTKTTSREYYTICDYTVKLSQYIDVYNAEMAKYNVDNGFTSSDDYKPFFEWKSERIHDSSNPLEVEKYESVRFITIITNNSNAEAEDNTGSYRKYATRVRTTQVSQTLTDGLQYQDYIVLWHHARTRTAENITSKIKVTSSRNNQNTIYSYTIPEENNDIILEPGDTIAYYTTALVTESNLSLNLLSDKADFAQLTNVNNRTVNKLNTSDQVTGTSYLKMKDVVIAGRVFTDSNKDGYMTNESGKAGINVVLFGDNKRITSTTTNEQGYYTFGRRPKTNGNTYIKYYVEFEYDGSKYKATEVYGGDTDGTADGMLNLNASGGAAAWRQGNNGLPGSKSGSTNYMIDSNAYEFDNVRIGYGNRYRTIGYNRSYENTSPSGGLSYTKDGHTSTLNETSSRIMTARSFIKQDYNNTINSTVQSNTNYLFLQNYAGYSNAYPETEYLKYINLGLVEREKVDLSIEADVHSVKTTINGEEMSYDFDKNNPAESYHKTDAYNLSLYQSDYNYRFDRYYDENALKNYKKATSELNVEITYRIKLTNNAFTNDEPSLSTKDIPIQAAINEMAIYYNKNLVGPNVNISKALKNSSTGILENRNYTSIEAYYGSESQLNSGSGTNLSDCIKTTSRYITNQSTSSNNGYGILYLSGTSLDNVYIDEGTSQFIDIKFTVDKDTARALKINNEFGMIAEIGAYTTRYASNYKNKALAGKYAGLVDIDSNPSNVNPFGIDNYNNYEDDTYKVGIKLNTIPDTTSGNSSRNITGMVWDDSRSTTVGTANTGIQYIGNGEYKTSDAKQAAANKNPYDSGAQTDKPIAGVKVSLWEIVQTGSNAYYEVQAKDRNGNKIEAISDSNGRYTLKDFIPGYYIVRFDYGYNPADANNILYNGQDYKSTKYYNGGYYTGNWANDNIGSSNNFIYFDQVKNALNRASVSDAQDDEIRRLNVNSYSETITSTNSRVLANTRSYAETLTKYTSMFADSTIFYAKPENISSAQTNMSAIVNDFNITRIWSLNNLDFGIEYRPETSIVLDKTISHINLKTSDGTDLMDIYFTKDASGNSIIDTSKSKGYDNTQFLPNTGKITRGFVYLNMDTDVLGGSTVTVEYNMEAANASEVDRINQNLDNIKYEVGANSYTATYKVYGRTGGQYDYSANATAAQLLGSIYYNNYNYSTATGKESYSYLTKIKKPYRASSLQSTVNGVSLYGSEYYGRYLGQTYYTGSIGNNDIVAQLKVDNILDYADNNFTFNLSNNNTTNRTWQTTSTASLRNDKLLDFSSVSTDPSGNLIDKYGIRYDNDSRSNLVLSVDTNKQGTATAGNTSMSRFLIPSKAATNAQAATGNIELQLSKVLSAEDIAEGRSLNYENLSEIVKYTTLTGRRTTLPSTANGGSIIGNANVKNWNGYNAKYEDDTDGAEIIQITPPTGLTK